MNACIAIMPPEAAIQAIEDAMRPYMDRMASVVPKNRWYVPLVSIQEQEDRLRAFSAAPGPIHEQYTQTVKILSIGEGKDPLQLWAYLQTTPGILEFRKSIIAYLAENTIATIPDTKEFIPHIFLGAYEQVSTLGIPDSPIQITCPVQEIFLLHIDPYEVLGSIPVTP